MLTHSDIIHAYKYSSYHKDTLIHDNVCGCFDCLKIFDPCEIKMWIEEGSGTAICPYCGTDTIIGESSGYPISKIFLKQLKKYWCSGDDCMIDTMERTEEISNKEMQARLIECFKELWGREDIQTNHSETSLTVQCEGHTCDCKWDKKQLMVDYSCSREIHDKEWQKKMSVIKQAISTKVPAYYLEYKGKCTTIRKKRRSRESKILLWIYPYKEDENGGWDTDVETLTIYECDFEVLASGISSLDYTSDNEFTKEEWKKILANWRNIQQENQEYASFIQYVIDWTSKILTTYDDVMIEGNL